MKIPNKILKAFNAGLEPGFNDCWNKANGYPSRLQYAFLRLVESSVYGICGHERDITQKDIKNYVPYTEAQIDLVKRLEEETCA